MSTKNKRQQLEAGNLGEQLVAHWLQQQRWDILAQGWHSRWGELDIVAYKPKAEAEECLAFVEVKTRSRGNWDLDGLLAITATKQAKLWKTAQTFLAKHPDWTECPCRFDVALVQYIQRPMAKPKPPAQSHNPASLHQSSNRTKAQTQQAQPSFPAGFALGDTARVHEYALTLVKYIEAAFSG